MLEEPHFSRLDIVDSVTSCSPFCSDVSDSWARGSVCLSDSAANSMLDCKHENQGPRCQPCSSPNTFPGSFRDLFSLAESDEICYPERTGASTREIPDNGVETSLPEAHSKNLSVCGDNLNMSIWKAENESQFKHVGEDIESERM